jgi:UDP-N-acetylmuramyl pentapeptide phosphotransferase/UDP-N-acetylglucosamine-1-phosphate transferase
VVFLGPVGRFPLPPPLDTPLGWLASPLTILWLAGVTNFFNFMDGIDGLAGSQTVASCIGVAIAAWSPDTQPFALALAAAAVGFLVFNRPPAKIFLGDTGSTSIGFALAAIPLLAPPHSRPLATLAVGIGLSLFLLDPIETLIRLAIARHPLGTAHRMHSYQRLARTTRNPGAIAIGITVLGAALAIGGGLAYRNSWMFWPVLIVAIFTFAIERNLAERLSLRTPALDTGRAKGPPL